MIQEALDYMHELGRNAKGAKLVEGVPSNGRSVLLEHNGQLVRQPIDPPMRKHTVSDLESLIQAHNEWAGDDAGLGIVWVNENAITLVLDDLDRRDTVTLPLHKSQTYESIQRLVSSPKINQADLIRLLRTTLRCVSDVAKLRLAVQSIKWKQAEEGQSVVEHGKSSLGRSVEMEVAGGGDLPEAIIAEFPPFINLFECPKINVPLDLEIGMDRTFAVRPLVDHLSAGVRNVLSMLAERMTKEGMKVFMGTP